jgi:hypothetical protein
MASDRSPDAREFRDALYEALSGGATAARDADPLILLDRLTNAAPARDADRPIARQLIERLHATAVAPGLDAAVDVAAERFETPSRFREAIYFARCLARDASATIDLLAARHYLEAAIVPSAFADLSTDRSAVLDATTFASFWLDGSRAGWMLDAIAIWRRGYVSSYVTQHARFRDAIATIAERVDADAARAAALARLNSLRRLGPALGAVVLNELHDIERLYPCAIDASALTEALQDAPICPVCAFALGHAAPLTETRRVLRAIDRALTGQQTRLARRVVSRIIDHPGAGEDDKIERFIRVVQASDVTALALILDDGLVEFLRDLLETPPGDGALLSRLARSYPEVTLTNLDAAVSEFRHLLETALREDGRVRLSGGRTP